MPAFVAALSFEYSQAAAGLTAASTDAIGAVGRVSGGSMWTSAAAWLFRGSVSRRFDVIIEGAGMLEAAANALLVLDAAVSQAESEMATAREMLAQPLSTNPFVLPSSFVVVPGVAELAGATARRDEAYRRAAETLTALALTAPISERYHAEYVEQQLRKDGIDIDVRVQDGVIVDADWDGLFGKKMWIVMALTAEGRKAQADLKDSYGYDDGFFSLKTWNPYHGGGRIGIAYMEGDELRMFLEGLGSVPLPGAGGVAKVGVKVVGKVSAKVSAKVASKVAAKVSAKVAKKVSKDVSAKVAAKATTRTGTNAGENFVERVERHTAGEYVAKRAAAQKAADEELAKIAASGGTGVKVVPPVTANATTNVGATAAAKKTGEIFDRSIKRADGTTIRLQTTERTLQKKGWGGAVHAPDFGVHGNYNPAKGKQLLKAIEDHLAHPDTITIRGTYKGGTIDVIHSVNPKTGLNTMQLPDGQYLSGWKLNPDQLKNVLERGSL